MWQERPKIISSREVLDAVWHPTVAQLINHDQTVHVTSGEDPELVDFYFHERKPPHGLGQVVSVSKDIYDSVAIAHDRRPLAEQTAFYAVLYSTARALQPCRVIKFIQDEEADWEPSELTVSFNSIERLFVACFVIAREQIMVVTDHGVTFFNHELIEISKVAVKDLDRCMDQISCVSRGVALYGSGFLVAAVVQCVPA